SSFRRTRQAQIPDPDEMDAAFDGPDDDHETHTLLGQNRQEHREQRIQIPGDYDFERDYTLPPSSPPPFEPYSESHPAQGNTNGIIPTNPPARPTPHARHFLGGILPTSFLPRQHPSAAPRVVGGGQSGVFTNLAARPGGEQETRRDGPEYVPEDEQKDGPPSYQAALRDAVPPYWDTTVVLPSSSSPFGPLSSSISGDEILIDGMPSGNFFGFFWNLIVSVSFQFVGFLLTYVLHTTHAAKYGSRAGLGITFIQFGLNLRSKAETLIETGQFPSDPSDPDPPAVTTPQSQAEQDEIAATNALDAFWGPGNAWPMSVKDPLLPVDAPPVVLHNPHEGEAFAVAHNTTLSAMLGLPTAGDVGRANEYFSFMLMSLGWFLVLTSVGGWWRVKRFERKLKQAQRESEAAQAAANRGDGAEVMNVETITTAPNEPGPNQLRYYTAAFSQAFAGARDIQRGFFGMHGRPVRGSGHAPVPTEDGGEGEAHELFDASGYGLEPMASPPRDDGRTRGLW
ncbi:hypothetical protein BCR39DRAFT_445814, partial [Naematelia encephala]